MTIERRQAFVVFLLCALPRVVALGLASPPALTHYWELSESILRSGAFGDMNTSIEPLYPAFLAAARWLTGDRVALVLLLQIVVAAAGGIALWHVAYQFSTDRRAAWVATLLYAFDPYLVRQSISIMEVAFLTALLIFTASAYSSPSRRAPLALGVLLGLCVMTRFSVAPVAIAGVLLLARRSARLAVVAGICVAAIVLPWMVRGYMINGSTIPSRAGANLFVSLSVPGEQVVPRGNPDVLVVFGLEIADRELDGRPLTPTQYQRAADDIMMREALRFAREHPWRAARIFARNFAFVFNPRLVPYHVLSPTAAARMENGRVIVEGMVARPRASEILHATWRGALLLLAVIGLYVRGFRREDAFLWAIVASFVVVHTIFFPTTRLVTPMVFVQMVFAASVVARFPIGAAPTPR